jgi:hypothetical protein
MFQRAPGLMLHDLVLGFCHQLGVTPRVAPEATQSHAVVGLGSAGIGVALVPASTESTRLGGVQYRPLAEKSPPVLTALAWRRGDASPVVPSRATISLMRGGKQMGVNAGSGIGRRASRWRIAAWGTAGLLLLLPLVAMQFTDEVGWDVVDFAVFGAMLFVAGGTYELVARMTGDNAYRAASGVALATAFILVWLSLGVGIIGNDGDTANLMYFGVLAVGVIGAIIARLQPRGMARALFATALGQVLVAAIALIARLGLPWSGPAEILLLNGLFVALWLTSAWLFWKAAQGRFPAGRGAVGASEPRNDRVHRSLGGRP